MINNEGFKEWLTNNTQYSQNVVDDQICRMKRADRMKAWDGDETYLFYLEKEKAFCELSVSVRSQIRKAVRLYTAYIKSINKD